VSYWCVVFPLFFVYLTNLRRVVLLRRGFFFLSSHYVFSLDTNALHCIILDVFSFMPCLSLFSQVLVSTRTDVSCWDLPRVVRAASIDSKIARFVDSYLSIEEYGPCLYYIHAL
jgi:hypothetical protein